MTSLYDILHLNSDAGQLEIKQAYFQHVRKYPPDRFPDEFMKIREAYEILSNARARRQYDEINALSRTEFLFYREAEKAIEEGDYNRAIQLLEQMIRLFPDHAIVRQKLGDAYSENGNSGKALAVFEGLVQDEPDHAGYAGKLANAYMQRGWNRKAVIQFQAALRLDQDNLSHWINLISCQMESSEYTSAAQTVELALAASRQSGWDPLELYHLIVQIDIITENLNGFGNHVAEMKKLALAGDEQRKNVAWFLTRLGKLIKSSQWRAQYTLIVNTAHELVPDNDEFRQIKMKSDQESARQAMVSQLDNNDQYNEVFFLLLDFEASRCLDPNCAHCLVTQFKLELTLVIQADQLRSQLISLRSEYPDLYRMKQDFFNEVCSPRRHDRLLEDYRKRFVKLEQAYPDEFKDRDDTAEAAIEEEDWNDALLSTQMPAVRDADKVGRNDPCPCGSGKKYKKCCGK